MRELLINVGKHAQTDQARVQFVWTPADLRIEVEDHGNGFDVSRLTADGEITGFGLFSLRERLANMGGQLAIHSRPGEGTRATLRFPLEPALLPHTAEAV